MADDRQSPSGRQCLVHVGCTDTGPRRDAYYRRYTALEYQHSFFNAPKPATLSRLRRQAPEPFTFVLRAWQLITHEPSFPGYRRLTQPLEASSETYGHFKDSEAVQAATHTTLACAEALEARAVLFETPPSFTPSPINRQALSHYFETLPRQGRLMVWDPKGVWAKPELATICRDLDLVLCQDPLEDKDALGGIHAAEPQNDAPEGGIGYYKISGLARTQGLSAFELETLAERGCAHHELFCVFNTVNMVKDAARFLSTWQMMTELD